MKRLSKYNILASMGALLIAAAACTPKADEQPTPNEPLPGPSPEPPVEQVEQRLVSLVKLTPEGWEDEEYEMTYYFNYDSEDRVNKITTCYEGVEDGEMWTYTESFAIDYMSQDFIQITGAEDGEVYERGYAYLNEKGYVESYDDEEYTYDLSGYLHKVSYSDSYDDVGTATYRWRDGNISSVEETWGVSDQYMYAFQYNTNNRELINIDPSEILYWNWLEPLGCSRLSWIGLRGKLSKNYVTSITSSNSFGDKSNTTMKWSNDNNGYPKICRIKHQYIDDTGATEDTEEWLMEISYLDETGEVTPPQP